MEKGERKREKERKGREKKGKTKKKIKASFPVLENFPKVFTGARTLPQALPIKYYVKVGTVCVPKSRLCLCHCRSKRRAITFRHSFTLTARSV